MHAAQWHSLAYSAIATRWPQALTLLIDSIFSVVTKPWTHKAIEVCTYTEFLTDHIIFIFPRFLQGSFCVPFTYALVTTLILPELSVHCKYSQHSVYLLFNRTAAKHSWVSWSPRLLSITVLSPQLLACHVRPSVSTNTSPSSLACDHRLPDKYLYAVMYLGSNS